MKVTNKTFSHLNINMCQGYKVEVYRNLRHGCFSVRLASNKKLLGHCDKINLKNATFNVKQGGRARTLKTKHKNVHAWVTGYVTLENLEHLEHNEAWEMYYNPYFSPAWLDKKDLSPVRHAEYVKMFFQNDTPFVLAF